MKKFMTVFLFVLLSTASSQQSYAMMGDVPDDMTLLVETFHFVADGCKQCINFLKSGISHVTQSKKGLIIRASLIVLAIVIIGQTGGEVFCEGVKKGVSLEEWCLDFLNFHPTNLLHMQALVEEVVSHGQMSGAFNYCVNNINQCNGGLCRSASDEIIFCAMYLSEKLKEQCIIDYGKGLEFCEEISMMTIEALKNPQIQERCLQFLGRQ